MTPSESHALLARRCQPQPVDRWDVRSRLAHFTLANYALPKERLASHIPEDRFEIAEFNLGGQRRAMVSAVPFLDLDFRFPRLVPFAKFRFAQTNYRVYLNDRRTGEPGVWFFGTALGSRSVAIPRLLWRRSPATPRFASSILSRVWNRYRFAVHPRSLHLRCNGDESLTPPRSVRLALRMSSRLRVRRVRCKRLG